MLEKPISREAAIAGLMLCVESLNNTDPREAWSLLRVVDQLKRRKDEDRNEYSVGLHDGNEDRRTRHRISQRILEKLYGQEYIRGYEAGWKA